MTPPKSKPAKSTSPSKSSKKPALLYRAGQVVGYQVDGTVALALCPDDVPADCTSIPAKQLLETKKVGRYRQESDVQVDPASVISLVRVTPKGRQFDIAKRDLPQQTLAAAAPAEDAEEDLLASDEEEAKAPSPKATPPKKAKSHKKPKATVTPPKAKTVPAADNPPNRSKSTPTKSPQTPENEEPAADDEETPRGLRSSTRRPKGKPVYKDITSSDEDSPNPPKKRRAKKSESPASSQSETEGKKRKPGKKQKLRVVARIDLNEEVDSQSKELDTRCCVMCADRNVLRAAVTRSMPLFKKVTASDQQLTSLWKYRGPEMKSTALSYAIEKGNEGLIRAILEEEKENTVKWAQQPTLGLSQVGTGRVSREAFGVDLRRVNMSRGGRQGNNAFLIPEYDPSPIPNILPRAIKRGIAPSLLDLLSTLIPHSRLENDIGYAVRTGDLKLALHLVKIYNKRGGFGLNELHEGVLKKGKLPEFKKVSVTKKAMGNFGITPLHCACINPDVSHLQELVAVADDINIEDAMKWKPVHYAALCSSPEPIKLLLAHGANLNDVTRDKTSPLMLAARRNRIQVAEFLLGQGANIDMKNRKGKSALHFAVQANSLETMDVLFKYMTKKTLDMPGPDKMTPLILAATKGHIQAVDKLIEQGAGVKRRDKFKRSALLMAVKNGHSDIASVLLAHNADPAEADSSKNTPLHYSCAYGWWQCTELLLENGADVNAANDWKLPPLLVALLKGHFGLMKKLLEVKGVDVNCKDEEGRTLLSRSIDVLSPETLLQLKDLLAHKNADPNLGDLKGLTPLHHLASLPKPEYERKDAGREEKEKWVQAQWALREEAVEALLAHGGELDARAEDGSTPLVLALASRNPRLSRLLLCKGSDLTFTMKDGSTPLHAAGSFTPEMIAIVGELLQKTEGRAGINQVDGEGFTPLLRMCESYQSGAKGVLVEIKRRIREDLMEEAKSKPKEQLQNEFLASMKGAKPASHRKKAESPSHSDSMSDNSDEEAEDSDEEKAESSYLVDENLVEARAAEEFQSIVTQFGELILAFIASGADPMRHVEKLLKYRSDPQLIRTEYEEYKTKEALRKTQKMDEYSSKDERVYFVSDFDGSERWNEYCPSGLKGVLHFLLSHAHEALARVVLQAQWDWDQRDFDGDTALHCVVRRADCASVVRMVLDKGANPNVRNCKGRTPLHEVCTRGKPELVTVLMERRAEAELLDVDGTFPLKIAVEAKDSDTVRTLLEHGVDPNFIDAKKRTALHHAFNSADVSADASFDIESLLLEAGADINLCDVRARTPLHYAFVKISNPDLNSRIDPVETVSSACGMRGLDPNKKDLWGRTPLHYAAQRGAVTSAMMMIENGAEVGVVDQVGNSALGVAMANGHSDFATMLLQHKLDISIPVTVTPKIKDQVQKPSTASDDECDEDSSSDSSDHYSRRHRKTGSSGDSLAIGTYSTFRAAVRLNWLGVAYLLLMRGYDYMLAMQDALNEQKFKLCLTLLAKVTDSSILRKSNDKNQNLFHTLAIYGAAANEEVTKALGTKLHLRKVDPFQRDSCGCQPVHLACSSQYPSLVSFLLNLGADVNSRDSADSTPLVHAVTGKGILTALPTLEVLAKADFNVRFRNGEGLEVTPILHAVMQSASKETVLFLLHAGADITAKDGKGRNLLVHAIRRNNLQLVEAILGWPGLDLKSVDEQGWSYAHHVVCPLEIGSYENEEILSKLAESKVSLSAKDTHGRSPYWYACGQKSGRMKKALEKLGVSEERRKDTPEAEFRPERTVDFHSDFEEYLKTKAQSMEEDVPLVPDPAGDFSASYEVVGDFDLLMVRVDIAYGPFSAYLFYRMQLLRDRNRDVFVLFTRWGRIGEVGAFQRTPFASREEGETEFKKVFKEKTKNEWGGEFHHVKGKYRVLPARQKQVKHQQLLQIFDFVKAPQPHVGEAVRGLIKQLTDSNIYTSVFSESEIDLDVLNFSNIGKSDLVAGESLLCEIGAIIQHIKDSSDSGRILELKEVLYDLSSRFYEIIPMTSFLHSAVQPIQEDEDLKHKMDLLDTLRNVEVASKIILGALHRQDTENPYDYCYHALRMDAHALSAESEEYQLLQMYAANGGNSRKIVNIFKVEREGEAKRIQKHAAVKNRMLLWHGSGVPNLIGIFTQGLRIAPPEAPSTGYMFGKGVYFADYFSKSLNYCYSDSPGNLFLLLAEVVLGKSLEKYDSEDINKLPKEYLSVKGIGEVGPDLSQSVTLENGVTVPCGPEMKYPEPKEECFCLEHNEYIVYDTTQVRLRYLVELKR